MNSLGNNSGLSLVQKMLNYWLKLTLIQSDCRVLQSFISLEPEVLGFFAQAYLPRKESI